MAVLTVAPTVEQLGDSTVSKTAVLMVGMKADTMAAQTVELRVGS